MQKITPCLWFNTDAEEAVKLYTSTFKRASIGKITRYDEASAKVSGMPVGSALTVSFTLEDQEFTAMNGGPLFKFTEAVSFIIPCETQEEVDHFWNKLSEGGDEAAQQCGWLKDKYGLSWQVVPKQLNEFLADSDPAKALRTMQAMLQMKKLDIAALTKAHDGE